jgi:protoporphyrin/coproporphyrin ferrochelatase
MAGYDAFLLVSFGGPEGPDDVIPFLQNVTAGRGVPPERLAQVAEHYYRFGGVSPINQQCRDLLAAVEKEFAATGISLPVYWGNRNWQPYLADAMRQMAADGVTRALAFVTSAYSSYSSCRQYLDDIEAARAAVGPGAPQVGKLRQFFNHPGFIEANAAAVAEAATSLGPSFAGTWDLVFTAHSIPVGMSRASGPPDGPWPAGAGGPPGGAYTTQLADAAGLVASMAGYDRRWRQAYNSRSGPPSVPWLEPDINDCLEEMARSGSQAVVVSPIGFVSDHMEVKFDLDVEAAQTARRLGLRFARAATAGTDRRFVSMIADLVRERTEGADPAALGRLGVGAGSCPAGCCGQGARRPPADAPAGGFGGSSPRDAPAGGFGGSSPRDAQ